MRGFAITTLSAAVVVGWTVGTGSLPFMPRRPVPAIVQQPVAQEDSQLDENGTVTIQRDTDDPHFFIDGDVAGKRLNFVVDTGASDVTLGIDNARTLGLDIDDLDYNRQMIVASGAIVPAAEVLLPRLRIGDIQLTNVTALVVNQSNVMPLLGQNFLKRLHMSTDGDTMTLTKS
jgi:aspartyl protease family protein